MSAADHTGKIRSVPVAWRDDAAGWWAHVAECPWCSTRYAPPDAWPPVDVAEAAHARIDPAPATEVAG